jgi:hypothetical protein
MRSQKTLRLKPLFFEVSLETFSNVIIAFIFMDFLEMFRNFLFPGDERWHVLRSNFNELSIKIWKLNFIHYYSLESIKIPRTPRKIPLQKNQLNIE